MATSLYGIQDVVIKIAQTISKIMQVDVEVIDREHNRIAGTGEFKAKINQNNLNDGHGYRYVIETGKRLILDAPKEHPECSMCAYQENCSSLYEIGTPIVVDGQIEGAIGIICNDPSRLDFFIQNLDDYLYFVDQMVELIAGKTQERQALQKQLSVIRMLDTVISQMDTGVMILNKENRITMINELAKKQLGISDATMAEFINVVVTGDTITGKREYKIITKDSSVTVVGEYKIMEGDDADYSKILVFNNLQKYRSQVYSMALQVLPHDINSIVTNSQSAKRLKAEIHKAARTSSAILLTGETGTGKEVTGTAIWRLGPRNHSPFVYFNCASVPETLLDEALFGRINTSGTAAAGKHGRIGRIEMANEGVLYLDEIDALPMYYQLKLETVLAEKMLKRKGSSQKIPLNVQVMAATNKDLKELIEKNKFREPLYYLISVMKIAVPPLRERRDDIEDLVRQYIDFYAQKYQVYFKYIDQETMDFLKRQPWYGNIRELESAVECMVSLMRGDGIMDMKTLPKEYEFRTASPEQSAQEQEIRTLEEVNLAEIKRALDKYGYSKKGKQTAAEKLGIGIATLYRKIDTAGLKED